MEALSLQDLQAALLKAQEVKPTVRLSERNVVDLMDKLQTLGFLENDVIHSIQGREYITPIHLEGEIKEAVKKAGGRLALTDLQAILLVDSTHCQRCAQALVDKHSNPKKNKDEFTMSITNGDIITSDYFKMVVDEIAEELQNQGFLLTVDLAKKYRLSSDMTLKLLSDNLNRVIKGQLDSGLLYTHTYIRRIKAQLRGALLAARVPVTVTSLLKLLNLDHLPGITQTAAGLIDGLVTDKVILGSWKSNTFIPESFANSQRSDVSEFYTANNFIEKEHLARVGLSDVISNATDVFPGCIALDTVFISPTLLSTLRADLEEVEGESSWTDVQVLLPTSFSTEDINMMVEMLGDLEENFRIISDTYIVSSALMTNLEEPLRKHVEKVVSELSTSETAAEEDVGKSEGAKLESTTGAGADSDDDWSMGGKKKQGKKTNKARKTNKNDVSKKGGKTVQKSSAPTSLDQFSITNLSLVITPHVPNALDEHMVPEILVEGLAELLKPYVISTFESVKASAVAASSEGRRQLRDKHAASVLSHMDTLLIYNQGLNAFCDDEACLTLISKQIIRTEAESIFCGILRYIEVETLSDAAVNSETNEVSTMEPSRRKRIINDQPPSSRSKFESTEALLAKAAVREVCDSLIDLAQYVGIRVIVSDKKNEKSRVQSLLSTIRENLNAETKHSEILVAVLQMLLYQNKKALVPIPGKAISLVIQKLKKNLPEDAFEVLASFHGVVVAELKGVEPAATTAAADGEETAADVDVSELVDKLKVLVAEEE